MKKIKLLRCPFCGSGAYVERGKSSAWFQVRCRNNWKDPWEAASTDWRNFNQSCAGAGPVSGSIEFAWGEVHPALARRNEAIARHRWNQRGGKHGTYSLLEYHEAAARVGGERPPPGGWKHSWLR